MAKRVAELIVEVLANAGVERVYGLSGDSLNGITDAIRKQKQVQWVHVRHEETAAFAAGAEAHLVSDFFAAADVFDVGHPAIVLSGHVVVLEAVGAETHFALESSQDGLIQRYVKCLLRRQHRIGNDFPSRPFLRPYSPEDAGILAFLRQS